MTIPRWAPGAEPLASLTDGELSIIGRLVVASNATLLCDLKTESGDVRCVYKPVAGERPLWDFPEGSLAAREVAAYLLSEAAGWHIVPPTVLRDGPLGPGMCQLWITDMMDGMVDVIPAGAARPGWLHVLDAVDAEGEPVSLVHLDDPRLRQMALFDAVINNADRKGGHILVEESGAVLGVDHGVSFHTDDKLRTVLWGWGGTVLTTAELTSLRALRASLDGPLGSGLAGLLDSAETEALGTRIERLLQDATMPTLDGRLRPIPWPAF